MFEDEDAERQVAYTHHLYLALDVDYPVSVDFGLFGVCTSLASDQPHGIVFLHEGVLGRIVQNKTHALLVGLETKLFGNIADIYIRFMSALVRQNCKKTEGQAYALQMVANADSRSRSTNISIK